MELNIVIRKMELNIIKIGIIVIFSFFLIPFAQRYLIRAFRHCHFSRLAHPDPLPPPFGFSEQFGRWTTDLRTEVPLLSTLVETSITDFLATIKIIQEYENPLEESSIETIYKFPLDEMSSVFSFRAILDDGRIIEGVSKKKEQARAEYEAAVERGATAFLMEEERPDIFEIRCGQLKPKQRVKVEISLFTELKQEGPDSIRFFFPTTMTTRYAPPLDHSAKPFENPPFASTPSQSTALSFSMQIDSPSKILSVETPSDPFSIRFEINDTQARGMIQPRRDRDLIVIIRHESEGIRNRLWIEPGLDQNSISVMAVVYPELETNKEASPQEIFIVIDKSGSMEGDAMQETKKAVQYCLDLMLESGSQNLLFNVISFESTFEAVFTESTAVDSRSIQKASQFVRNIYARGGTEILQ